MRRELVWIHDLDDVRVGAIGHGFFTIWTDERLDQSERFGFEIAANHPKADLIAADTEIEHRGRRYLITEIEQARRGTQSTIKVEAVATWYELGWPAYIGSLNLPSTTPILGALTILTDTRWFTGTVPTSGEFSMEAQDRTPLAMLREWAKITGTHLRFDTTNRTVSLLDSPGVETGMSFRYARNLTNVRKRTRPPEVTVLVPFGADGLSIAGVNGGIPYVEDFTYYTDRGLDLATAREKKTKREIWSDASFIAETELLAAAEARLATRSVESVAYELDVVDLSEITGIDENRTRAGDTVRVFDPEFADDLQPTITRLRREWLEPWRHKIELGFQTSTVGDGSTAGRPASSSDWRLFTGPIRAEYPIRSDGSFVIARIPLRFRAGGIAFVGLTINGTGVGAGTMHVSIVDDVDPAADLHTIDVPYTDGQPIHTSATFALPSMEGFHPFKVRVTTTATGGPSDSLGVNIDADRSDPDTAAFWIHALGAVQESPVVATSETFEFTGAIQQFTVPDNVEEITITVRGAQGGGANGGLGAEATATFPVIPGQTLDVYVGGTDPNKTDQTGPWPNGGGNPEGAAGDVAGWGGGGSSDVRPEGSTMAGTLLCAGGGGGTNDVGSSRPVGDTQGGAGGFFAGGAGWGLTPSQTAGVARSGAGATQTAGGAAGSGGTAGTFGQGGDAGSTNNSFHFAGGAGGGGYYGGGGAGTPTGFGGGSYAGDGGGGAGWIHPDGYDLNVNEGVRTGHGQVVVEWSEPV